MRLSEKIFDILRRANRMLFGWVKDRFPTAPWADLTRKLIETDQRQLPRSHAEKYELKTIWYWYPLYCLGGISFVAFIVRGLHHWAAHIMIAAVFLHMCRVYFTGAYKKPRELNWILGVLLLFLTLGFGYTGYLLPANNLSDGAATIGINMAKSVPYIGDLQAQLVFGGTDISTTNYVLRMYWWHVFILPSSASA